MKNDINLLIYLYQNEKLTCGQIAEKLKLPSKYYVHYYLEKSGIKFRKEGHTKYKLNENFFEKIDNEEKAYFLGLLFADGCNHKNKSISIGLTEEDKHILERFKKNLKTDRPLYFNPSRKNICKNKIIDSKATFILNIHNKKICKDLLKLGMTPNKSLTLIFPDNKQIPEELMNHFLRGYFDGDGCLTSTKPKIGNYIAFTINLCVSKQFGQTFKEFCKKTLKINVILSKSKNNKITNALIGGNKQVEKFIDWLYKDSNIYLYRKEKKYKEFKKYLLNRL